jgi:hypothetical protein
VQCRQDGARRRRGLAGCPDDDAVDTTRIISSFKGPKLISQPNRYTTQVSSYGNGQKGRAARLYSHSICADISRVAAVGAGATCAYVLKGSGLCSDHNFRRNTTKAETLAVLPDLCREGRELYKCRKIQKGEKANACRPPLAHRIGWTAVATWHQAQTALADQCVQVLCLRALRGCAPPGPPEQREGEEHCCLMMMLMLRMTMRNESRCPMTIVEKIQSAMACNRCNA